MMAQQALENQEKLIEKIRNRIIKDIDKLMFESTILWAMKENLKKQEQK